MEPQNDITVSFPKGKQVLISYKGLNVLTDQPVASGGHGEALSPFDLFLASLAGCAGFFALLFFQKRNLDTKGLDVRATPHFDNHALVSVDIQVQVPDGFPEQYREPLLRSIDQCTVKKAIAAQPPVRVAFASTSPSPQEP